MPLLETVDLRTHFTIGGRFADRLLGRPAGVVAAVDGVSIAIEPGEVFGVVGESGSGKTTLGRSILRLVRPTGGRVVFDGADLTALSEAEFRPFRRRMQIVFQDPHAALNPAMTIGRAVAHPLEIHAIASGRDARRRVAEILERVGLHPAERFLDAYPSDLSGGQKQRVVIARAIVTGPDFLVADEPVSMLDMSVRAKILDLLLALKRELRLTLMFITHDLATAKLISDRLAILYLGQVVEQGPAPEIYRRPRHPYTQALLAAIPSPDPARRGPKDLPRGEIPDAARPPANCRFHPRCPRAFGPCGFEGRDLVEAIEQRWTRLPEAELERERRVLGDLSDLRPEGYRLVVPLRRRDAEQTLSLLEALRQDGSERALSMVAAIRREGGAAVAELLPGSDPRPFDDGGVEVSCHLYPEQAAAGETGTLAG